MPIIRPASALRNDYVEISRIAKETKQPVFLTKNGTGDTVLLSMEEYDKQARLLELYEKLSEGEEDLKHGRVKTLSEVSAMMKEAIAKHE
ncbi:MAG: type II toxin-antitoxin system Phd/YefM family antitoxin [Firmicutes bacterium]|nr:type II toxin-antitoxin system Phd/YefM family antitoxin [Bacillota bacterium]